MAGLGKGFLMLGTTTTVVVHHGGKSIVGVSSIMNLAKGTKRMGCTTTGTNIVNVAGTTTGRLTSHNVHIGTITPKYVVASVASGVPRSVGRNVLRSVPLDHLKRARRITGTILFLTSSSTSCVAKRILGMSNNVIVWIQRKKRDVLV